MPFEEKDLKILKKFEKTNNAVIWAGLFFVFLSALIATVFVFNFQESKKWIVPRIVYLAEQNVAAQLDQLKPVTDLESKLIEKNRDLMKMFVVLTEQNRKGITAIFSLNMFTLGLLVFLYGVLYLKFFRVLKKYLNQERVL